MCVIWRLRAAAKDGRHPAVAHVNRNVARSSFWQPQSRNVQWQKDNDAHLLA